MSPLTAIALLLHVHTNAAMSFDFVLSYDASMQNTQASVTDGEQKLNRSSRTFKPSACKLNRGAKAKFRNERDRLRHSRLIIGVTQKTKTGDMQTIRTGSKAFNQETQSNPADSLRKRPRPASERRAT